MNVFLRESRKDKNDLGFGMVDYMMGAALAGALVLASGNALTSATQVTDSDQFTHYASEAKYQLRKKIAEATKGKCMKIVPNGGRISVYECAGAGAGTTVVTTPPWIDFIPGQYAHYCASQYQCVTADSYSQGSTQMGTGQASPVGEGQGQGYESPIHIELGAEGPDLVITGPEIAVDHQGVILNQSGVVDWVISGYNRQKKIVLNTHTKSVVLR